MITERKLEAACMETLDRELAYCWLWKINSMTQGGLPDLEIAWHGHTTKIEFKLLKGAETIHQKWEDQRQLLTLVRYEQQTQRSWAVAFQKGKKKKYDDQDSTIIYKPSSLLNDQLPMAQWADPMKPVEFLQDLWNNGAIRFEGFNHRAIAELVRQTHV